MCGIVGFTGNKKAAPVLFAGLKKLEYRGYDSSGAATIFEGKVHVVKTVGRVRDLEVKSDDGALLPGSVGIGHTRWATHGAPSDANAHPMVSNKGVFTLVHNGIVENYAVIKDDLIKNGTVFSSETDSEVVVNLIEREFFALGDVLAAITNGVKLLRGSFALGIITPLFPNSIFAVRKDAPLVVGVGDGFGLLASDVPALSGKTNKFVIPEEGDVVRIDPDEISVFGADLRRKQPQYTYFDNLENDCEKDGYPHFMLKEIYQQPEAVERVFSAEREFGDVKDFILRNFGGNPKKIDVVGCGSAYHAGLSGKYFIEKVAKVPVNVYTAGEYRYNEILTGEDTLTVVISQSGETADTLAALREAKKRRSPTLGIVNAKLSSIARESDVTFFTDAGTEIAVATTKGYSTQLAALFRLGLSLTDNPETVEYYEKQFAAVPDAMRRVIREGDKLFSVAKYIAAKEHAYYIGRASDYATACEGALKLKEISYVHAEAYAAAELKHGTISLICDGVPVVALSTSDRLTEKMLANVKEVHSRGGVVFAITDSEDARLGLDCAQVITVPKCDEYCSALVVIPALQLLSYYAAEMRGCDVDKPRNLAKSVTVE